MQELLDKAQEVSGVKYDISSYSDIVQAIHVVQDEMGIMNATRDEAMTTLQGSFSMTKSAWDNLVTGMADPNADIGQLVTNVVESAGTALGNLIPVVEQALTTAGTVVEKLVPEIMNQLPGLITGTLPTLLKSAVNVVTSIGKAILQNAPLILKTGIELLVDLINGFAEGLPQAIPMIVDAVMQIAEVLIDNADKLIDAGINLITALIDGFIEAEPKFLQKMPELLKKLAKALIDGAAQLLVAMGTIAKKLLDNFVQKIPEYGKAGKDLLKSLGNGILSSLSNLVDIGVRMVEGIWKGISSGTAWIKARITEWVGDVVAFFQKVFHIGSPSKLMRDEVGKWIGLGVYEGWEENNPIDMIKNDLTGFEKGMAVSVNTVGRSGSSSNTIIDYDKLADATVTAFTRAGIGIEIDKREFGRITRGVINYA